MKIGESLVKKVLSGKQRTAIEEVINIGLGRAAMTLTSVARKDVMLIASNLNLSNINTGHAVDQIKKTGDGNWVSVSQTIGGDIDAVALMVLNDANALGVVQSVLGGDVEPEAVQEYEPEVMSEIANIILNASISAISSMMKMPLESYLPVHHLGDCESVMLDSAVLPVKLLTNLDMIVAGQKFSAFLSLSVSNPSLQKMMLMLEQYLESESFEWLA